MPSQPKGFAYLLTLHGSAMEGYYPHELILGYEVCQMKGTLIDIIQQIADALEKVCN